MRIESRARARALQAIYAWDMRGNSPLDRVAQQVWDDLAVSPEERQFAGFPIRMLLARGSEIDALLAEVTENWRLSRLGAIERSVLQTRRRGDARGHDATARRDSGVGAARRALWDFTKRKVRQRST